MTFHGSRRYQDRPGNLGGQADAVIELVVDHSVPDVADSALRVEARKATNRSAAFSRRMPNLPGSFTHRGSRFIVTILKFVLDKTSVAYHAQNHAYYISISYGLA